MKNPIPYLMYYFKDGFFGYGEEGDFQIFSLAHLLPIIICILIIVLIYKNRIKIRNSKHEENIRYILGFTMLLVEMGFFWWLLYVGQNYYYENANTMLNRLPLQVCEWTLFVAFFALLKKSQTLFSMAFYLTMSCGIVPLLAPAVITHTGPTYFRYYQYWGEHLLPIISVYYLMFVYGFKPKIDGIRNSIIMLAIMTVLALKFNSVIDGANYLYLKDQSVLSMLDIIPNNIVYRVIIFWTGAISLLTIDYLIYTFISKKTNKRT